MAQPVANAEDMYSATLEWGLVYDYIKPSTPNNLDFDFTGLGLELATGPAGTPKDFYIQNGEIVSPAIRSGIKIHLPAGTVAAACQYRDTSGGSFYKFVGIRSETGDPLTGTDLEIGPEEGSSNQLAVGLVVFGHKKIY